MGSSMFDAELLERFWDKVDVRGPDDCWEWQAFNYKGYGRFGIRRWRGGGFVHISEKAHRVSWIIFHNQEVPDGMCICHHCDNPPCVNPAHLFLGTHKDNWDDAIRKGRIAQYGEMHRHAKLTDLDLRALKYWWFAGYGSGELAKCFGVTQGHVCNLAAGRMRHDNEAWSRRDDA